MNINWEITYAAIYRVHSDTLRPIFELDEISLDHLIGIETQKHALIQNTERFMNYKPANNALLWGARGTGKSSLIKAVLNAYKSEGLRVIEFFKNDLYKLPEVVDELRSEPFRFIIYCDDFSFGKEDDSFAVLKTILEGSIERKPDNILLYATSNRRHLIPESFTDNLDAEVTKDELHYSDSVENKLSLADRFGLWLSFYQSTLEDYYKIIDSYFADYKGDRAQLHDAARMFSMSRGGSRSGRTAQQFYNSFIEQ